MDHVSEPSGSRNAKEKLENGPVEGWGGHNQWGCRMKCMSVQIRLWMTSLSNCCSVKTLFVSGSLVGTPLNVTLERPVDGTREAPGKG
jgi:hypothetical protein